jgi:hypothetical protein
MVCHRAGATIPSLVASRLSSSKGSLRSQCALLGSGPHTPRLRGMAPLPKVNAKRSERSFIVFSKGDAQREAVEDLESVSSRQTVPDISQAPRSEFHTASIPSWVAVGFGAALLLATAFLPSVSLGPLGFLREGLYTVGSPQVWRSVLYVVAVIHVVEASFAFYLARRVDPQNEALWFWQTVFLGLFSLSSLLQKSKQKKYL